MERQFNAAIQQLPEEIRILFDATHPLASDVMFQPRKADAATLRSDVLVSGLFAGGMTGCLPLCLLVALIGSVLDGTQASRDGGGPVAVGFLFVVLSGIVILSWHAFGRPLWTEWRTLREKRAGTLRRGLFLTPEALIVRVRTEQCDIIPRESIVSLYYAAEQISECWRVVYRAPDGRHFAYDLDFPPFETRKPNPSDVLLIRQWSGIGNAAFIESGQI